MYVGNKSIDSSIVKKELEDLLDKSIQISDYIIPLNKKLVDLSKLNANALHDYFLALKNPNVAIEEMQGEITEQLEDIIVQSICI